MGQAAKGRAAAGKTYVVTDAQLGERIVAAGIKPPAIANPKYIAPGERVNGNVAKEGDKIDWPEPKPLPNGLPKVDAFDSAFLPDRLAPWVSDTSDRLQCPPDYVAVAALTALGSVIGRRVGIKPQTKTDWTEIPNLWGCLHRPTGTC